MTQPSEESIRAACAEAGIIAGDGQGNAWRAILALARRIEAEGKAVPVATHRCLRCHVAVTIVPGAPPVYGTD